MPREGKILAEISVGDLLDKITILEIKKAHIKDTVSVDIIKKELKSLEDTLAHNISANQELDLLVSQLKEINQTLWNIEDDIRACEGNQNFGEEFISLARKVYFTNDKRAQVKKAINRLTNSNIEEIKSYQSY